MKKISGLPPGETGLPVLGETLEFLRDGFHFISDRAAQHGPIFRTSVLGRPTAVIAGPEACAIWTDTDLIARDGAQPGAIFEIFAGPSLPHLDGEDHRRRKMLMLEGFTSEALASYLPGLEAAVSSSLARWAAAGEIDWMPELKRLAIEGICGNFLGIPEGPEMEAIVRDYDTVTKGIGALPVPIPGTAFYRALRARDRLLHIFEEAIRVRRENPTGDGLSRILAGRLPDGTRMTPDAMKRELHHVVIAGYVIFAEFARIVIELGQGPEIRARLEAEARPLASPLAGEALDGLPQMSRFVMEVKRLCPILPAIFGRAKRDFEFKGFTVPEGWMVLWALRATNVDPETYAAPEDFDPERFAPPRNEHLRHEHAFVPHGPGPMMTHQCPGTAYATLFMKVFTVLLLRSGLRWEFSSGGIETDWSLTPPEPRGGMKAVLTS